MKKTIKTYLLLIIFLAAGCVGRAPAPEQNNTVSDHLLGRFAREMPPAELDLLLSDPTDSARPGIPVNDLLFILDRVDAGKLIKLISPPEGGVGAAVTLDLIQQIRKIGCARHNISDISVCTTSDYHHLNVLAQLISNINEDNILKLTAVIKEEGLNGSGDSDIKYLSKIAYLVVAADDKGEDQNLDSELQGAAKLADMMNVALDGRDMVHLLSQFDANSCPHAQNKCVDENTFTWNAAGSEITNQMQGLGVLLGIIRHLEKSTSEGGRFTPGEKLGHIINGTRTAAGASAGFDTIQKNYIENRLVTAIEGGDEIGTNVADTAEWRQRMVRVINKTEEARRLAYLLANADIDKILGIIANVNTDSTADSDELSRLGYLVDYTEDGSEWPGQVNGPQKFNEAEMQPHSGDCGSSGSNGSGLCRLILLLNNFDYDRNNTADASLSPLTDRLLPLLTYAVTPTGSESQSEADKRHIQKIARLMQDISEINDISLLLKSLKTDDTENKVLDNLNLVLARVESDKISNLARVVDGQRLAGNSGLQCNATDNAPCDDDSAVVESYLNKLIRLMLALDDTRDGPEKVVQLINAVSDADKLVDLIYDVTDVSNLAGIINDVFKENEVTGCSDTTYTDQTSCESNNEIWGSRDNSIQTLVYLIENVSDSQKLVIMINAASDPADITYLVNSVAMGSTTPADAAGQKLAGMIDNITRAADISYLLREINLQQLRKLINGLEIASISKMADLVNQIEGNECWLHDGVVKLNITNGGSGYLSAPSVSIGGSTEAIALVSGGAVTELIITKKGTDGTVTFIGGGGSSATATTVTADCSSSRGAATGLGKIVNLINNIDSITDVITLINDVDDGNKLGILINKTTNSSNLVSLIEEVIADSDLSLTDLVNLLNSLNTDTDIAKIPVLLNNINAVTENNQTAPTDTNTASDDFKLVIDLMKPYNNLSAGVGINTMVSIIDSLDDGSSQTCTGDCETAVVNLADVISDVDKGSSYGSADAVNYNDATAPNISIREAMVRLISYGGVKCSTGFSSSHVECTGNGADLPGLGASHLAVIMNDLSGAGAGNVISTLNSDTTSMSDLLLTIGCGDQVFSYQSVCESHSPSLW